jgi:hypothetical protein
MMISLLRPRGIAPTCGFNDQVNNLYPIGKYAVKRPVFAGLEARFPEAGDLAVPSRGAPVSQREYF